MKVTSLFAVALLCASFQASAVRVTGEAKPPPAGSAALASPPNSAAAAAHADDSSSLREGMITGVTASHDQIEVNGSWLKVEANQTRLFRQGRAVTGEVLVKGQAVKFTLLPGDAQRATLGVIYVP